MVVMVVGGGGGATSSSVASSSAPTPTPNRMNLLADIKVSRGYLVPTQRP